MVASPSQHPVNARQAITVEEVALMYLKGLSALSATTVSAVWLIRPSVPLFQVFTAPGKHGTKVFVSAQCTIPAFQHVMAITR